MAIIKFDKSFMFGACTSAEQSEGHKNNFSTNWDIFFKNDPKAFFDEVGPENTSEVYEHYKDDIKLYKELGFDSFRTSFSWARIFPKENIVSKEAIAFYHNYIDELISKNIKVMFCLNHFDLPDWIINKGGLENSSISDNFEEYAKLILDEFGHKIDYLMTFNEPIVPIQCGYLGKFHWPRIIDNKKAIQASYTTILMHSKVINLFNTKYRNLLKTKIGVIVNLSPALAKDCITNSSEDQKAADIFNLLHNYALLDAMCNGTFSDELINLLKQENLMIDIPKNEKEIIAKNKIDFIGINYYSPFRVTARPLEEQKNYNNNLLEKFAMPFSWKESRMNPFRGWEILPDMMDILCKIVKERYNNIPFYISENGMGVQGEEKFRNSEGYIDDYYRIAFIKEHLLSLNKAIIKYNVNCFGYHMWASIDCWSWLNAYKNRYGFIEVDIANGKRIKKASAYWLQEFVKTREFDEKFDLIEKYIDIKTKQ